MPERPLSDQPEREAALDLSASFIVQAPAGSGKTGLLTRRFLRALASVEEPEQVLAMTFTRKAANEMRSRVMRTLQRAADHEQPAAAFEQALIADGHTVLEHSDRQGWDLLSSPMRLQIMTLDALNRRLVAARPLRAERMAGEVLAEQQTDDLYREATDALLDWLESEPPLGDALELLLRRFDISLANWRVQFGRMLATRDQWLPAILARRSVPAAQLRREGEAVLEHLVNAALLRAEACISAEQQRALASIAEAALADYPVARLDQTVRLAGWPAADAKELPAWQFIARLLLTDKGQVRRTLNKNNGFPPDSRERKQQALSLLASLADNRELVEAMDSVRQLPPPYYTDAQWQAVGALQSVLPVLAAELQRLMQTRGAGDYPSLAAAALNALDDSGEGTPTELALRLDYTLRHILVDEMQDTSAAQYRL
ncbi:MAG: UvrD-helicase domain-containing protein, partial [Pseudomonadota bacterium]